MGFLIHGRDSAAFVDDSPHPLHELHQAYLDGWAAQLVARGPTLSPDGSRHTGSIHVLETDDPAVARGFALEEPFAQQGWYSDVAVVRFDNLTPGTMWDRPVPTAGHESSFALVSWSPTAATPDLIDRVRARAAGGENARWVFAGLLLSDDADQATGLAGSLDLPVAQARSWLRERMGGLPVSLADISVQRWTRGGRR